MAKKPTKDTRIGFRVSLEEKARAEVFTARLRQRYPYLSRSDVYRELIGFTDTGMITPEMRRGLRSDQDDDRSIPTQPISIDTHHGTHKSTLHIAPTKKGGRK